ncbi:holin [Clostridium massiliodielmoense]|uniref:holin n=1 Tax=Clostridium massiliodielmoense TaxID=1776385 RepID=UPI0004DA11FA|nr:holin [Clostridium massiliodielmoense]KEH94298.1 holin [Clostridium botulinum C/D str. BKT12695]
MVNNRLKNYGLWSSLFAFIPIFLEGIKVYNINIILPNNYEIIVKALLGLLVLAGILNNPTTSNKGFIDDKINKCNIIKNAKEFNKK